jgi:hypothetical protein
MRHALGFAWSTYKQRWSLFTAMLLTMVGAWVALELIVIAGQRLGLVWWAVAHVAFFLAFAGLEVGFLRVCLACYDGAAPTYADLFGLWAAGPRFFAAQLLYLVLVVVGLALLVIPGVYLGVRYALVGFCLADGETQLLRAFQHSARLSRGTVLSLVAIGGALLVLNVLGASLVGLGLFITVPPSGLVMAAVFRQLGTSGRDD